jgi:hypothetical protein
MTMFGFDARPPPARELLRDRDFKAPSDLRPTAAVRDLCNIPAAGAHSHFCAARKAGQKSIRVGGIFWTIQSHNRHVTEHKKYFLETYQIATDNVGAAHCQRPPGRIFRPDGPAK